MHNRLWLGLMLAVLMLLLLGGCQKKDAAGTGQTQDSAAQSPGDLSGEVVSEGSSGSAAVVTGTQIGNMAPEASLVAFDGRALKLSEYRGKPVVLNFWADW